MNKNLAIAVLIALVIAMVALPFSLKSCSRPDDGLSPQERQMANRLDEIVQKSGGDWNKLSPEDRDYLVNEISYGNEYSARMLLSAKAGKLRATPGPPAGQ